jgi:Reverse transcriptase (RNA-dependent DNA polymerase)
MPLLDDLLGKGYFPKEWPPCFSTSSFAARILANLGGWLVLQSQTPTKMCTYSLAKAGGLRRKLSVPNPVSHHPLCEFLSSQWNIVRSHCRASLISLSKPVRDRRRMRAVVPALPFEELPIVRAANRSNAKCVVVTDLSDFYSSLYTHSVPWAIHGKATAKAQRRATALYGNKLDELLRAAQDQQTVGIPIGPDTSLIVAELVLSSVDHKLARRIANIRGLRYMDDFELYFAHPSAAENGLAVLQEMLLDFELRLNPHKTTVEQAPIGIEHEWVHVFRNFIFSPRPRPQSRDLIRYFDCLTKYVREYPKEHIVKYALARLQKLPVAPENWVLYQSLLATAVTVEPGAIQTYILLLIRCTEAGCTLDPDLTESTLNDILEVSAPLGHHHEMAWSLWAILFLGLRVHGGAAAAVSRVDNSVVALLALDAEQQGLVPSGLDRTGWQLRMTQQDLFEDQWLLSYEANVKGWLASSGGGDHVASDPRFGYMKTLGVEFYSPVQRLSLPNVGVAMPLAAAVSASFVPGAVSGSP